jgi:hypothetical protein
VLHSRRDSQDSGVLSLSKRTGSSAASKHAASGSEKN